MATSPDNYTVYIYVISNSSDPYDENSYIGSTSDIKRRMKTHKSLCNIGVHRKKLYDYIRKHGGWECFDYNIIHQQEVSSINEQFKIEQDHIDSWEPTLNDQKALVIGDYAEYLKNYKHKWYMKNRDRELKKAKDAYAKNPDKKKKAAKEWREKNKERDTATRKAYRDSHKEEQKQLNKAWREKNKAEIKADKARKYQEQKAQGFIKIACDCGSTYKKGTKNRHEQTAKHKQWATRDNPVPEGKIRCPCGAIVSRYGIRRHERGNPHKKWAALERA